MFPLRTNNNPRYRSQPYTKFSTKFVCNCNFHTKEKSRVRNFPPAAQINNRSPPQLTPSRLSALLLMLINGLARQRERESNAQHPSLFTTLLSRCNKSSSSSNATWCSSLFHTPCQPKNSLSLSLSLVYRRLPARLRRRRHPRSSQLGVRLFLLSLAAAGSSLFLPWGAFFAVSLACGMNERWKFAECSKYAGFGAIFRGDFGARVSNDGWAN